jgi:hypothetical protein
MEKTEYRRRDKRKKLYRKNFRINKHTKYEGIKEESKKTQIL